MPRVVESLAWLAKIAEENGYRVKISSEFAVAEKYFFFFFYVNF